MENEEPIFRKGFLALTYEQRRRHLSTTNIKSNKPLNQGDGMRSNKYGVYSSLILSIST